MSATFNVTDLSPFKFDDAGVDLRINHFEERGNDGDQLGNDSNNKGLDVLHNISELIIKSRTKKAKKAINGLIYEVQNKSDASLDLNYLEVSPRLINLIQLLD